MEPTEDGTTAWAEAHIACPLTALDATSAVRELVATLAQAPGVQDVDALREAILIREGQSPTYLGGGVAMPHARTEAVNRLVVAVGVSRAGLPWGVPNEKARLVFLVGVPRDEVRSYLEMVRRITKVVRRIDWIERAVNSPNATALATLLRDSIEL